jgi:hypothetical protein
MAGSPLGLFSSTLEGLSGRVIPLHHHRHCTHVSFAVVLGMDVPQHRLSGQCPLVSNVSVEAFDALCVRARKADEDCTLSVLTDAIHNKKSTGYRPALM